MDKEHWKPLHVTPWLKSLCIYLLYGKSICCAKKRDLLKSMAESSVSFSGGTPVSKASSTTCVTETAHHWSASVAHPDCLGLHFSGGKKEKRSNRQQYKQKIWVTGLTFLEMKRIEYLFAIKKAIFY